jgi:hypothetical protein
MLNINKISLVLIPWVLPLLTACDHNTKEQQDVATHSEISMEDQTTIPDTLIEVGEGKSVDGQLSAKVLATDSLTDSYQELFIQLEDSEGTAVEKARVRLLPEMKMGMMAHGAPAIQPGEQAVHGFFIGGVVFIMPTSIESQHNWAINLLVDQEGVASNRVNVPIHVKEAKEARTVAFDGGDEGRFFLSLIAPRKISVGNQFIRFMLHRVSKNEFPAVLDGYEIALNTHMPDMGHGSEGNENAKAVSEGYYKGKVNLSMPGLWEVKADLLKDGKKVSTEPVIFKIQVKK